MLHLTITHLIHLTRDQCYKLHEGEEMEVTGVSVPVWHGKEYTSEPAREVFCNYVIKNSKEDTTPIKIKNDGYLIDLPYRPAKVDKTMSPTEWRFLNFNYPDKLNDYYRNQLSEATSKNLLDIKDGGSCAMIYNEHNKMKQNGETLNIVHFVNIERIEMLKESIV